MDCATSIGLGREFRKVSKEWKPDFNTIYAHLKKKKKKKKKNHKNNKFAFTKVTTLKEHLKKKKDSKK